MNDSSNRPGRAGLNRRDAIAGMAALTLGGTGMPVLAQSVRGVTPTSIKVGVSLALTGAVAHIHSHLRAGQQAYIDMVNDRGGVNGRKIELIIEDNEYSAQKGVTAMRKLVLRDNVFAILGSNGVAQINPVLPFLAENGVPVINSYTGLTEWTEPPRRDLYSVFTPHEPCMQAIGRWAAKDGHKKILLVYFDAAVARDFSQHAVLAARAVNPNVQVELMPIKMGTNDYVPHALEIIRQKPDAIIGANLMNEFLTMLRELKANGSTTPIYTTTYNVFDSLAALNPQAIEGAKAFTFTRSPLADTPAVREYRAAMAKYIKPAMSPDFPSLFTFAGAKIFVEALTRIKGELTHAALYTALEGMKDYDTGILPPVSFSPSSHQGTNALFKMVAKGGHWVGTGEMVDAARNVW